MWRSLRARRRAVLLGSLPLLAAAILWWAGAWHHRRAAVESSPHYVGDQSCAACHRAIYASYQRTAMHRTWQPATTENVIEDYAHHSHPYDPQRDLHYEMIARDGQFFQREYRLDEQGAPTHELVRQVSYIIGSGGNSRGYGGAGAG